MSLSQISPSQEQAQPGVGYRGRTLVQIRAQLKGIESLWDDLEINEIQINGPGDVWVMRKGVESKLDVRVSEAEIKAAIQTIAAYQRQQIGEVAGSFVQYARLPGFRITAALPPVSVKGPMLVIRRHAIHVYSLEDYVTSGALSEKGARFIKDEIVEARETFVVAGGTASGKTTFFNALIPYFPPEDRIVLLEQVAELQTKATQNVCSLECNGEHGVDLLRGVELAMRLSPKRILIGEMRGAEAFAWLTAAETGHPGSAGTLHANSAVATMARMETMALQAGLNLPHEAIQTKIGDALRWSIYLERQGNVRRVSQIARINGFNRSTKTYDIEEVSLD